MLVGLLRGEGTPSEVGYRAGQELAREYGIKVDAAEIIEAVARRLGFEPHREPAPAGVDIVLDRCPFASGAVIAPDIICELHRGLAEGIAATAAGDVRRDEPHPSAAAGTLAVGSSSNWQQADLVPPQRPIPGANGSMVDLIRRRARRGDDDHHDDHRAGGDCPPLHLLLVQPASDVLVGGAHRCTARCGLTPSIPADR